MSEEKELFPLDTIDDILSGSKGDTPLSTTITLEDASSKTAEILAREMGSDDEYLREGKVDWRRFSHLNPVDPYWMTHFKLKKKFKGGNWSKKYADHIGNMKYSIGGRHKRLAVNMQQATSGNTPSQDKPKKKRGIVDRLLGRKKELDE